MSYFPTDIPFMSDDELIENGLKKPYKKPEIIKGTDLVSVVRCKDCIHHAYDEIFSCYWCEHPGMVREVKPDFYCAYGERKE